MWYQVLLVWIWIFSALSLYVIMLVIHSQRASLDLLTTFTFSHILSERSERKIVSGSTTSLFSLLSSPQLPHGRSPSLIYSCHPWSPELLILSPDSCPCSSLIIQCHLKWKGWEPASVSYLALSLAMCSCEFQDCGTTCHCDCNANFSVDVFPTEFVFLSGRPPKYAAEYPHECLLNGHCPQIPGCAGIVSLEVRLALGTEGQRGFQQWLMHFLC